MIKSRHRWAFPDLRSAFNDEQGLNLVEVLIALAILAAVGGVFLVSVSTSSKAVMVSQQQVSAEGLAKSQMESIQQQNYSVDGAAYTKLTQIPAGYGIQFTVVRLNPQRGSTGNDQGLQKITITVTHGGNTVFTLQGYKCATN